LIKIITESYLFNIMLHAGYVKGLTEEEVKVLKTMYSLLKYHDAISTEDIASRAMIHIDRVEFALTRLNWKGLVVRDTTGYRLLYAGLDTLVLWELAYKDLIKGIGRLIGVGKEADVVECIDAKDNKVALKLFRLGRISFRDVRKRPYRDRYAHNWLLQSVKAAKREYRALSLLKSNGVRVPNLIAYNKHAILMEYIEGERLADCIVDDAERVLNRIIDNVKIAYCKASLVSSDLSEYNVLYDGHGVWIIDWPQSISYKHRNTDMLLARDIKNILNFFRKRYGLNYDPDKVIEYVKDCKSYLT